MPEAGTICQPDTKNPFLYVPAAQQETERRSIGDFEDGSVRLVSAIRKLPEKTRWPPIVSPFKLLRRL